MGAIIEIKNLDKTYVTKEKDVIALKDINLSVDEGEIFGIIGLSGAGKSTLVRCINYLEVPTKGTVTVEGKVLGNLNEKELLKARQSIGMIFQQFNLLAQRSVLDNVCFPLEVQGIKKKQAKKRAKELLEVVGLTDRAKSYPAQLSGGQKQRVAIARALATNPKVLLCDEATSALDPTTTKSILSLIKEINQKLNITVVIITHEMAVIEEICSKVAIIDHSRIAEMGDVKEVFTKPKSQIARQLIFTDTYQPIHTDKQKAYRIIFDGRSSFEPVISNLVLESKIPVNIMFANTKNLDGKAMGEMVIQIPDEDTAKERVLRYLSRNEIHFEEVGSDV